MFVVGISYTVETDWGPVSSLSFYDNYTYTDKQIAGYQDTQQHIVGCLVSASQLFTYIDFASSQNHPWLGKLHQQLSGRRGYGKQAQCRTGMAHALM